MNNIFIICLVLSTLYVKAQTSLEYSISPWLNQKRGAVSITLDDNIEGQYLTALPIMNQEKYKFKATFFTITGYVKASGLGSWAYLRDSLSAKGHEVASHTVTHRNLNTLSNSEITDELANSDIAIEQNIPGVKCVSVAWPFGVGGDNAFVRSETSKYYIGGRNAWGVEYNFGDAHDAWLKDITYRYNVSALGVDKNTIISTFTTLINNSVKGKWVVLLYHGITATEDGVGETKFKEQMDAIKSLAPNIWVAPFGDVLKYNAEKFAQKLTILGETKSLWTLKFTDTLSNDVYNFPLSLKMKAPAWTIDSITQGKNKLSFTVNAGFCYFNAIPDGGDIKVFKKTEVLAVQGGDEADEIQIYPNPAINVVVITAREELPVYIISEKGETVKTTIAHKGLNKIDVSELSSGIYQVRCGARVQKLCIKKE